MDEEQLQAAIKEARELREFDETQDRKQSMNKLESIKERLEKVKRNPYDSFANDGMDSMVKWVQDFRDCAPDDISYLLQRLERYKEALEWIVKYADEPLISPEVQMAELAKEALKE